MSKLYKPFVNYHEYDFVLKLSRRTKYLESSDKNNLYALCSECPRRMTYKDLKAYLEYNNYTNISNYSREELVNMVLLNKLNKKEIIKIYKLLKDKKTVSKHLKKSDLIKIMIVDI